MSAEVRRGNAGGPARHVQRLRDVQGAGLSVGTEAAVVAHAVGHVAALLHLRHYDAAADGVNGARGDEHRVARLDVHAAQNLGQRVVRDAARKLVPGNIARKAAVEKGVRLGGEDVPHLRFAVLPLVRAGVGVIGMDLNGEIFRRIDELDEHRKLREFPPVLPQRPGVRGEIFRERFARVGTGREHGRTVGMTAQLPRFRETRAVIPLAVIGDELCSAPEIVLTGGGELENGHGNDLLSRQTRGIRGSRAL